MGAAGIADNDQAAPTNPREDREGVAVDPAEVERRFAHHPPSNDVIVAAHQLVRESCRNLADVLNDLLVESREKSLALTALDETAMWANACIARHQQVGEQIGEVSPD